MGILHATGTLTGASDVSATINLHGFAADRIGLLLTGTFDSGIVTPQVINPVNPGGTRRNWRNFNPRTSNRTDVQFNVPGLYYWEVILDTFVLELLGATSADIDWTLFLGARP